MILVPTVTLLPTTTVPPRDILYTTVDEAMHVANNLRDFGLVTDQIQIIEVSQNEIGGEPNKFQDGRLALVIRFNRTMIVVSPKTKISTEATVPFEVVAGELLNYLNDEPLKPWKFLAEWSGFDGTRDTWVGDVEK
jgi:hypothetical protein